MFISVKSLHNNLGVDETIGRFFVDRKVPADNIFWEGRLLYVPRGNGYISIPVYYDLLHRIGIPKEVLLEEGHIQFMEQVMHFAILVEFNKITFSEQLANIASLLAGRIKNETFYNKLVPYLEQPVILPVGNLGMPVVSLNRADVFLFILCDLPMTESQTDDALKYWYALHTSFLLMDDLYDYQIDKQNNDENSVLELGEGETGFKNAFALFDNNIEVLQQINPLLAGHFQRAAEGLSDLKP